MTKAYRCKLRDEVLTKDVLTRELTELRKPLRQVAEEYGVSPETVSNHAAFHGVIGGFKQSPATVLTKEVLTDMYVSKSMSAKEIAEFLKIRSVTSVFKALRRHGIATRKEYYVSERRQKVFASQRRGHHDISGSHWYRIKEAARVRGIHFDVSIEYAWQLWLLQNQTCALSGIRLTLIASRDSPRDASLDRIDSSLGYVEGNVQWIHKELNRMKGALREVVFVEWCEKVCQHKRGGAGEAVQLST